MLYTEFMTRRCLLPIGAVLLWTAGFAPETRAQEGPSNLQVLPATMSSREVRTYMRSFTDALGVRCDYCHTRAEGSGPRPSMDFASDDKEVKEIAREMMRMTRSINERLAGIAGEGAVEVTCQTCHRGTVRPIPIQDEIMEQINSDGAVAAAGHYRELRERHFGGMMFDFREGPLMDLGFRLLSEGRVDDALVMLRLNVEMHSDSFRAFDALAQGYEEAGEFQRAITFYRKSLELNPGNDRAAEQLEKLTAQ